MAEARALVVVALSTWSWAADTLAWARVTASASEVSSMVASAWPLVTLSPTATSTAVTVPEALNDAVDWTAGSRVPVAETVCFTVPSEAATSWVRTVAEAAAAVSRLPHHQPPNPPTASRTSAVRAPRMRRRHERAGGAILTRPEGMSRT